MSRVAEVIFFLVHRAGIVFIWVRRQIIFHVDDTW